MIQKRLKDIDLEPRATKKRSVRVARMRTMVTVDMIKW